MSVGVDVPVHAQLLSYALFAAASLFSRPRARRASVDEVWDALRAKIAPPYDVTETLQFALEGLAELLPAEGYYAYVAPASGAPLRLRLTRAETGTPQIGVNYAGLVAGAPVRQAPLELPPGQDGLACREDGAAGDPYLSLGLGPRILLRAALSRRQHVGEPERRILLTYGSRLEPALEILLALDDATSASEVEAAESKTQRLASEFALQADKLLGLVARLGAEAIGAQTGYCVIWQGEKTDRVWLLGQGEHLYAAFDPSALPSVRAGLWFAPELPAGIERLGFVAFALVSVQNGARGGAVGYGLQDRPDLDHKVTSVLTSLSDSLRRSIGSQLHTLSLTQSYLLSLLSAAELLDAAEHLSERHSWRVADLARDIGVQMALPVSDLDQIHLAGRLHDVGMVAVALGLPNTRGNLSAEGRSAIQQHPSVGANLLEGLPPDLLPPTVAQAVRHHHERWDGQGYPDGLSRQEIDLFGRILACAEVFIARTSPRSYRAALTSAHALRQMQLLAGSQLDPDIVAALVDLYAARGVLPQAGEA